MKCKKPTAELIINDSDISAILCALPLVNLIDIGSPIQASINSAFCDSAAEKLANHSTKLNSNEIRIISCAITCAILLLSGNENKLIPPIDSDWKSELSRHFFTLNRLDPIFQKYVDQIQS